LAPLRFFDYGAILLATTVTVLAGVMVYAGGGTKNEVHVKGPDGNWVFPQDAEELVRVPGPLGDTVVELRDGKARVVSSPCGNKLCVSAGTIHAHGQWIACFPNQVLVSVVGTPSREEDELDGTAW
jgi:hypothetical protein